MIEWTESQIKIKLDFLKPLTISSGKTYDELKLKVRPRSRIYFEAVHGEDSYH